MKCLALLLGEMVQKNSQLFIDDPAGNSYICALPFYEPLEYNEKDLILIEDAKPPTNTEPEIPETESAKPPDLPKKILSVQILKKIIQE